MLSQLPVEQNKCINHNVISKCATREQLEPYVVSLICTRTTHLQLQYRHSIFHPNCHTSTQSVATHLTKTFFKDRNYSSISSYTYIHQEIPTTTVAVYHSLTAQLLSTSTSRYLTVETNCHTRFSIVRISVVKFVLRLKPQDFLSTVAPLSYLCFCKTAMKTK